MIVAVLTLTRDRLPYTQHCFERLRLLAGCEFHHYVFDQDSKDGSDTWLHHECEEGRIKYLHFAGQNVGIARGMNHLVEKALRHGDYDVIVKFDNDCEVVTPNTLARTADVARENFVASPIVDGLRHPPLQTGQTHIVGAERLKESRVGGIFMATPVDFWERFRYPEDLPHWGGDDTFLCQYAVNEDIPVGYVQGLRVNHYETTDGQHERYPEYFQRRVAEGGPA
jgi:GT2 family glycosyltransferase